MTSIQKLREKRFVQWLLAYLAAAWLILQIVSTLADPWGIPDYLQRGIAVLLGMGVFIAATIAWYHGEKGRQSVSGPEILIIAGVLGIAAMLISLVEVEGDAAPRPAGAVSADSQPDTVAVLPFTDLSPGQDHRYFADGMAEEIISALTRSGKVRVAAKSSSFALRGQPIADVGSALSVATVLEGSVRTDGELLRVTVELVNAKDGFQIWSQQFDRRRENVLQVQAEISGAVVERLTGQRQTEATEEMLIDPRAYDNYLQARYFWNRRSEADLLRSVGFYRQAIRTEPDFARAYSGLADTYAVLGFYQYLPADEAFPEAQRLAQEALDLDPGLAEAIATRAYASLYYDRDWVGAENLFLQAIEAAPHYAVAHQWYANLLVVLGRWREAEQQYNASMRLDPLSLIARSVEPWALYYEGEYDRARQRIEQVIELDPDFMLAYYWGGWILAELGRYPEAIEFLRTAVARSEGSTITRAALARALILGGNLEEAMQILSDLSEPAEAALPFAYEIAKVHAALRDAESSVSWLEAAFEHKASQLVFVAVDPAFDSLRGVPAFDDIVKRLDLQHVVP